MAQERDTLMPIPKDTKEQKHSKYSYYFIGATPLERASLMVKPEPWDYKTEYVTVKFKNVAPALRVDWLNDGTMVVNGKEVDDAN